MTGTMKDSIERMFDPDFWIIRLSVVLLGYLTIAIPIAIVIKYVRYKCNVHQMEHLSIWWSILRAFAVGRPEYQLPSLDTVRYSSSGTNRGEKNVVVDSIRLIAYFLGIQLTLVSMGFFQERIMTQDYILKSDESVKVKFKNTQFLVFLNRIFALILSSVCLIVRWKREPFHIPPFYKHSYTSFSNTLSSWCQYEALKYVSFPTQTVCKASKVLPTMLLGLIVRGERYNRHECISAFLLAAGATLFFLGNNSSSSSFVAHETTASGLFLMAGYLIFDAFTLNWQKALFDSRPRVSRYQMMFGVNAFSAVLCFISLVEEGTVTSAFSSFFLYKGFARDAAFLSSSGALGQVMFYQVIIYMTIERFGPVIFAIMMTIRQIISICLSAVAYDHPMSPLSIFGLVVAFGTIFADIYRQYFKQRELR